MKVLILFAFVAIMPVIFPNTVVGQSHTKPAPLMVTTADEISIAYEVHGEGSTALVFVHGWSCDRSYWQAQVQPFSKLYKVVTIDLGGHGESGFGRSDWTIFSFSTDVTTVIRELKLDRVILIGHSIGR